MKKLIYISPLLFVLLLISLFWFRLGGDPRKLPSALLNKPIPSFQARSLSNQMLNQKMFQGHISVLTVWATWCNACRAEHPVFMSAALAKRVQVFGLNYKDSSLAARNWLEDYGNPYQQCIYDPQGKLAMELGVYGAPETYLIDKNAIIRYKYVGPVDTIIWQQQFLPRIKRLSA